MADLAGWSYDQLRLAQDKVLGLATGTLALSITFRGSLVSGHPVHVGWLAAAWILLSVTIFCYLLAILSEAALAGKTSDLQMRIERASVPISDAAKRSLSGELADIKTMGRWGVPVFRYGMWLCFFTGMVCLVVFALLNIVPKDSCCAIIRAVAVIRLT